MPGIGMRPRFDTPLLHHQGFPQRFPAPQERISLKTLIHSAAMGQTGVAFPAPPERSSLKPLIHSAAMGQTGVPSVATAATAAVMGTIVAEAGEVQETMNIYDKPVEDC